jgi:hypothetical protein
MTEKILVIGAGIAGLCTALALGPTGKSLTLIERDGPPPEGSPDEAFHDWTRRGVGHLRQSHAFLARLNTIIKTDRLEYDQVRDEVKARGSVRVNQAGNLFEGPRLDMRVDAFEGVFDQPDYQFLSNGAHGKAEQIDFLDENRALIRNSTFTTCICDDLTQWFFSCAFYDLNTCHLVFVVAF